MKTPYFRAGAGSIIYRDDGMVLVFKRTGEDIWQFQQGGLDAEERSEAALWRELKEETALVQADVVHAHPYPTWTLYEYPDGFIRPQARSICLGQAHRWWFLKLAPETTIDLTLAHDKEFEAWQWVSFDTFINNTQHSFKHAVYQELYQYYTTQIFPALRT